MTTHHLKGDPQQFSAAWAGNKEWEIRLDDRGFEVGDFIYTHETRHTGSEMAALDSNGEPGMPLIYTGRRLEGEVLYKLTGYGLKPGWCIITVRWLSRRVLDKDPVGMPESAKNIRAHVISFSPEGIAEAIYNTSFPLSFLGQQAIIRTTDIRFCEETQTWGIFIFGPPFKGGHDASFFRVPEGQGFASYEDARTVEVTWLNHCRLKGVSCYEYPGTQTLTNIRKALDLE